jgi:uncharacterized membrane protein
MKAVDYVLTGAGHFGFGFIVGTVVLLVMMMLKKKSLSVQLYAPFLPFLFGFVAALPYAFLETATCDLPFLANLFFFYSSVHCNAVVISLLGNIHLVMVICAVIYCFILMRYITLVKRVRRYGWSR